MIQIRSDSDECCNKNRKIDDYLFPLLIGNELDKKRKEYSTESNPNPMDIWTCQCQIVEMNKRNHLNWVKITYCFIIFALGHS